MRVLVAVPAFNEEASIAASVQSVLDSQHNDVQVVVLDNASTDRTVRRVQELAQHDDRISVVCGTQNIGMLNNFVRAFDLLAGSAADLVGFLPANDRYLPGMIDVCLEAIELEPDTGVFSSNVQMGNADSVPFFDSSIWLPSHHEIHLRANYTYIGSSIFRRDALAELGGFNMTFRYLFDAELLARAKYANPSVYVPQILGYRTPGSPNATSAAASLRAPIELALIRLNLWDEYAGAVHGTNEGPALAGVARYCNALSAQFSSTSLITRYRHLADAFADEPGKEANEAPSPHNPPPGARLLRMHHSDVTS